MTVYVRLWTLLTVFHFCAVAGLAQPDVKQLKEAERYLTKMVVDWDVPGMSVAVIQNGEIVLAGGYGIKENGKKDKVNEHSLYAIASNSKAFTATLIGMLVDEGKLSWDDKVIDYVPYFKLSEPWLTGQVKIKDLLSHRVGLGTFSGDVLWYKSERSNADIIKSVRHIPLKFDFRDGFGYSNLMYITAGEVIRAVTGHSWAREVQERILKPLEMNRTITTPGDLDQKKNYASPHARANGENIPVQWENWQEIGALGGIISSVIDLTKWATFNLNRGVHNGDTLLNPRTHSRLLTPHNNYFIPHDAVRNNNTHFSSYGLGWKLNDYKGNMMVSHTGGYDGMISAFTLIPDQNLGVVVLTNGVQSPIRAATIYLLDLFIEGEIAQDHSKTGLAAVKRRKANDTEVADKERARIQGTKHSLDLKEYAATYKCDMYGEIEVKKEGDDLRIYFENAPRLSATLTHWHYDVWKLNWDETHAWFDFGTVRFETDNDLKITGLEFDVPNNDIFFDEIKAKRVK